MLPSLCLPNQYLIFMGKTALQPCVCHVAKPLLTKTITDTYREKQPYSHVSVMLSILCLPKRSQTLKGKNTLQPCICHVVNPLFTKPISDIYGKNCFTALCLSCCQASAYQNDHRHLKGKTALQPCVCHVVNPLLTKTITDT